MTREAEQKREDFRKKSLAAWEEALKDVFPTAIPTSARWTDLSAMCTVLNKITYSPNVNHMFFPTGGGMDLLGAMPFDEEPDCLALRTGDNSFEVLKPSDLIFESVDLEPGWAYFRLESLPLQPCGAYDEDENEEDNVNEDDDKRGLLENRRHHKREEVVLVAPGTYAPRSAWDANEYDGQSLPNSARLVTRFLSGSPFVIFAKGSDYNMSKFTIGRASLFDAYDPTYATRSAGEFRSFIEKLATASAR